VGERDKGIEGSGVRSGKLGAQRTEIWDHETRVEGRIFNIGSPNPGRVDGSKVHYSIIWAGGEHEVDRPTYPRLIPLGWWHIGHQVMDWSVTLGRETDIPGSHRYTPD